MADGDLPPQSMSADLPPSKALPYLWSLVSAIGGAVLMYWSVADRMEKQITEKVNLVSRVAQLGERVEGQRAEIANLRNDLNVIRGQQQQPPVAK